MITRYLILAIVSSFLLLVSCNNGKSVADETEDKESETIILTKDQFELSEMLLGKPEKMKFIHSIRVNGKISASPSGKARVSSLITGKIKHISVNTGDRVNKGQLLCSLESIEFLRLQQEYAESVGRLKAVQTEYERQKELAGENIASQKTLLNAEAEYKSLYSACEGLGKTLQMLGVNPAKTMQGVFDSEINVYAPINGFISVVQVKTGDFAEPQRTLMEMIDISQLQLKLAVFEKELTDLKPGMNITFYSPGNTTHKFNGTLESYSRAVDPETKAITVIGTIQTSDKQFLIEGMYVEALIETGEQEVMALPDEAIIRSGESKLVLVQTQIKDKELIFTKKEIKTGISSQGFTEIINYEGLKDVLIKGGFNLVMD